MIAACIIVLIIAVVVLIAVLSGKGNSGENDNEYYVDGYHVYYDRKIIRHLKNK